MENSLEISIGELAAQAGLATSAIRYYESVGLIEPVRRTGGQRRYDAGAVDTLRIIAFAQSAGFTLAEMAALRQPLCSDGPMFGDDWKELATQKLGQLDQVIARAEEMKSRLHAAIACTCDSVNRCCLVHGKKED